MLEGVDHALFHVPTPGAANSLEGSGTLGPELEVSVAYADRFGAGVPDPGIHPFKGKPVVRRGRKTRGLW